MIVTVSGSSGLTNAYRSVLSATGSLEISGASRWDDMAQITRRVRWIASAGGGGQLLSKLRALDGDLLGAEIDGEGAGLGVQQVGEDRASVGHGRGVGTDAGGCGGRGLGGVADRS